MIQVPVVVVTGIVGGGGTGTSAASTIAVSWQE